MSTLAVTKMCSTKTCSAKDQTLEQQLAETAKLVGVIVEDVKQLVQQVAKTAHDCFCIIKDELWTRKASSSKVALADNQASERLDTIDLLEQVDILHQPEQEAFIKPTSELEPKPKRRAPAKNTPGYLKATSSSKSRNEAIAIANQEFHDRKQHETKYLRWHI
jgi:hypothetical protein